MFLFSHYLPLFSKIQDLAFELGFNKKTVSKTCSGAHEDCFEHNSRLQKSQLCTPESTELM